MIRELTDELKNKISAGEVVERPSSVVKELVENSLDAGANEISIILEKGGHHLIQVTDNGCGMSKTDLPMAFGRYSTSKIKVFDDLFSINSLGFRGEALSSIASVSEVKILSSDGSSEGYELFVIGGKPGDLIPAPSLKGTSISIKNLFYNTPGRKKFLKSPRVELRKVVEMVRRFALGYPNCEFNLISDNRDILKLESEKLESRIVHVMDPAYRSQLLPVNFSKSNYSINGFIGNLNLIRSRPGEQYFYLNNRFIKNRLMNSAAYQAYSSLLKRGEYPFFTINISVPYEEVDINVHPMKTEVRFKDEWRIFHVLKSAIEKSLESILQTIPDLEKPSFVSSSTLSDSFSSIAYDSQIQQSNLNFNILGQSSSVAENDIDRAKSYASKLSNRTESDPSEINLDNIWQVHSKYIVSVISSGLVIIDQHVAHERILFEEAMKCFDSNPMPGQTLLFPEVMEFSPDNFSTLLDILTYLEKMGFKMSEFGENTVLIEAIPSEMGWGNEKEIVKEMLDNYLQTQKEYSSFQEALAASFACKAAVKAGDALNSDEMRELVNRLFGTKHPYYCPHGRPIIIQLSIDELDRRFERI